MGPGDHPLLRQFFQDHGFGQQGNGPEGFMRGGFEHHGGPHALAWAIFAILLVLLLLTIANLVLAARGGQRRPRYGFGPGFGPWGPPAGGPRGDKALAILRHRYARGEISRDDYLKAREDLGAPPEPPEDAPTEVPPAA
jgi:uncharacterized membrane protein